MTPCNRPHLQRLLDESLPEKAERDLAEHLAACPDCQSALESLAGEKQWWAEASTRLGKSSARPPSSSRSTGHSSVELEATGRSNALSEDDDAFHFARDFAVDFLDPSDNSGMLGRLGEYEIVDVIGRGGMGIVLKGYQKELNRFVAVKVLAPHLATSGAARRRFAREAQATAAIVHPHVMAIHSVQPDVKLPYLVMPFVGCESLQERLDRNGPLDVKDILRIGMQTALGLAAAHSQGLVHRDVKPANILLETSVDRVLLTDFGLARAVDDATLTRTGVIAGTPQYMSPEQANGDPVDHRSDLFSLGGVFYAMCTGRPPFRAETTFGVLRRIREASPRPIREINPDIPEWLERIVIHLLAKDATDRIDSAEKVAILMEGCLAHLQQPTSPLPTQLDQWAPRPTVHAIDSTRLTMTMWRRLVIGAGGLGLLILLVLNLRDPRPGVVPAPSQSAQTSENRREVKRENVPKGDLPAGNSPLDWNSLDTELQGVDQALESMESNSQDIWGPASP
jgi:serine/threonine protein kinase